MRWHEISGWFDFQPIYNKAVADARDGDVFVEVGAWLGRSTCYLADAIRLSKKRIRFYTVDHAIGSQDLQHDATIHKEVVESHGGTTAGVLMSNIVKCGLREFVTPIFADSAQAALLFPPESVSFVFIDAGHSYERASADIRAWWPAVRQGGLIAGHDYTPDWPSVIYAVDEFFLTKHGTSKSCQAIACHSSWSFYK